MRTFRFLLVAAMLAADITAAPAAEPVPQAGLETDSEVEALALKWFAQMRTGRIDRTQLSAQYNSYLTDDAVRGMAQYLAEHDYGASPTNARIVQRRSEADQTFYVVKLVFPRGDAASVLIGLDADHKITGLDILTMAGD